MKTPKIVNGMNHIDDDIIVAANQKTSAKPIWARYIAIAAAFILVLGGAIALMPRGQGNAIVALDVNPSMEIEIDASERVVKVEPLNEEAVQVLSDMDLKKVDLNVAVNAIIGSMLKNGYLSVDQNSILISVDAADEQKAAALQTAIAGDVEKILGQSNINASVISQSYAKDKTVSQKAEENHISVAKATLVERIVAAELKDSQGNLYTYETLAGMKVNELKMLLESKQVAVGGINASGTAQNDSYIGKDAAIELALQHAITDGGPGISQESIKTELDYEHGRMIYDVEFDNGLYEFEYDIDAITGEIIKHECEPHDDKYDHDHGHHDDKYDDDDDDDRLTFDETHITADAAIDAALADANLTRETVRELECEAEMKLGKATYEVSFETKELEYEYLIDAQTGEIIRSEKEPND